MNPPRWHALFSASTSALALVLLHSTPARAAKPAEVYPEFAQQRASLGRVVLIADFAVVREEGGTPVFREGRTREYATTILQRVSAILKRKGVAVDTSFLGSMGVLLNDEIGFRLAVNDSVVPGGQLVNAPFFVDSLLSSTPDAQKRWRDLNRMLSHYTRKKHDPPSGFAQASAIAKSLNAGAIAIIRVSSWDVPLGKQWTAALRQENRSSRSYVGLTILSGTDGLVLWDDWNLQQHSLKPESLSERLMVLESNLP